MIPINEGQCGTCIHFGEHDGQKPDRLIQIAAQRQAPESTIEACGQHQGFQLKVSVVSGCADFAMGPIAQA